MVNTSITLSLLASVVVGVVALYYSNAVDVLYPQPRQPNVPAQEPVTGLDVTRDPIPFSTRAYWMRRANSVLMELSTSPCPFGAFGSVIVNHTDTQGLGEVVCIGLNSMGTDGNPTRHGEIAAIDNCSSVLTNPSGRYRLLGSEALDAYRDLSLYTNGEPCPMCASAIRWAGFKECIYGTTIDTLIATGWPQIQVYSQEIFERSSHLRTKAKLIKAVLTNETDPYFSWQFDASHSCPSGCTRDAGGACTPL